MSVNLNMGVDDNEGQEVDVYYYEGIPSEVWDAFKQKAQGFFPDVAKEEAWAVLLRGFISSVTDSEEMKTLIITDIPREQADKLEQAAVGAATTAMSIFENILYQAGRGTFQFVRFTNDEKAGRVLLLSGISEQAWAAFQRLAERVGVDVGVLFGHIFNSAHSGELEQNMSEDPHQSFANADSTGDGGTSIDSTRNHTTLNAIRQQQARVNQEVKQRTDAAMANGRRVRAKFD